MATAPAFFEVTELAKRFGGVDAVADVTLDIAEGEICSVIGPNGAGKTTLFNLISGSLKPDRGRVTFRGQDVTGQSPKTITRGGIARSFQIVNIFPRLTVYEHVLVATLAQQRRSWNMIRHAKGLARDECVRLLEGVGLTDAAHMLGGQLSHGNQKRLEVAVALAMQPRLLLLDEPTAGMATEEKAGVLATIRDMIRRRGCTVLLCEHDMNVVFSVSDRIWVMHNGRVITQGTPDQIRANETVRRIYLGEKA
jgi:branched-chain amino acid transport system ATP-binding protein